MKKQKLIHDLQEEIDQELSSYQKFQKTEKNASYIVNDKSALEQKIEELQLKLENGENVPWIEVLTVSTTPQPVDVSDDLARETTFYSQAMAAVKEGHRLFEKYGLNYERPTDYFAEMLKTDEHMQRVKNKLLVEQNQIEQSEQKRKQRDLKKYGKQIQQQQIQQKQKQKKQELESISKWRKARERGNTEEQFPIQLDMDHSNANQNAKRKNNSPRERSAKRQKKDQQHGFGGKKRNMKSNTSESTSDFSSFNKLKNKQVPKNMKKSFGKQKQRPGKKRRQSQKK